MSLLAARFANAAQSMVGTPFRLHGREPGRGLDCVGLVSASLEMAGRPHTVPRGYRLRNLDFGDFLPMLEAAGFAQTRMPPRVGEVVIARPGPGQLHLLVSVTHSSLVHAHAGLRRVVETPAPISWPILGSWRLIQD